MDILKYFADEPAALDPTPGVAPDDGPASLEALLGRATAPAAGSARLYRGYLAGTRLDADAAVGSRARAVGATALADPAAVWARPLVAALGGPWWTAGGAPVPDPVAALVDAAGPLVVATEPPSPASVAAVAEAERRAAGPALAALLADARAILLPEPAPDGADWSVFAREPLRETVVAALRAHPAPGARRFALPYQKARGEHAFYFEQWQLGALPPHIEEVHAGAGAADRMTEGVTGAGP